MKTQTAIEQWLTFGVVVAFFTLDMANAALPPQWAPLVHMVTINFITTNDR